MSRWVRALLPALIVAIAGMAVAQAARPCDGLPATWQQGCIVSADGDDESAGTACDDSTPVADVDWPARVRPLIAGLSDSCPSARVSAGMPSAPYHPPSAGRF